MGDIFITSDLHLGHSNILKHANRPFSGVDEMDAAIVESWNGLVRRRDTVYILGDFAWRNHSRWNMALNGSKILILGNHDRMNGKCLEQFADVRPLMDTRIAGQRVTLSHYAMRAWSASCHGSWHFYGHSHGRLKEFGWVLSSAVDVDVWGFRPVPWDILAKKMALKNPDDRKPFANGEEMLEAEENVKNNRDCNLALWPL